MFYVIKFNPQYPKTPLGITADVDWSNTIDVDESYPIADKVNEKWKKKDSVDWKTLEDTRDVALPYSSSNDNIEWLKVNNKVGRILANDTPLVMYQEEENKKEPIGYLTSPARHADVRGNDKHNTFQKNQWLQVTD